MKDILIIMGGSLITYLLIDQFLSPPTGTVLTNMTQPFPNPRPFPTPQPCKPICPSCSKNHPPCEMPCKIPVNCAQTWLL